jgi:hypothetical protein
VVTVSLWFILLPAFRFPHPAVTIFIRLILRS